MQYGAPGGVYQQPPPAAYGQPQQAPPQQQPYGQQQRPLDTSMLGGKFQNRYPGRR